MQLYLFVSLFYPPLSLSISCLSKFTYISFNPLLLISVYLSHIDLYLFYLFENPNSRLYLSMFLSLFQYIPHLFTSITFYLLYISLSIQVHAYLFQSLPLLAIRSSNLVHTVTLITNNYFYLSNIKEIENDTANIPNALFGIPSANSRII